MTTMIKYWRNRTGTVGNKEYIQGYSLGRRRRRGRCQSRGHRAGFAQTDHVSPQIRQVPASKLKIRVPRDELRDRHPLPPSETLARIPRRDGVSVTALRDAELRPRARKAVAASGELVGVEEVEGGDLLCATDGPACVGVLNRVRALTGIGGRHATYGGARLENVLAGRPEYVGGGR